MSERSLRRWESWTPDTPADVFFRDRKEGSHREMLRLLRAEFSCNEEYADSSFRIALQCSFAEYQRLEAARWFNIPVGFSNFIGVAFQDTTPIVITADFKEWGFYKILFPLPVPDITACLENLLTPLLDEDKYNMSSSGLGYSVVNVVQTLPSGEQIGFSSEIIQKSGF